MNNNAIYGRLMLMVCACISALCFSCATPMPVSSSKWDTDFHTFTLENPANSYQFPKTNVSFSVYNNTETLQIILKASDPSTQQMLLRSGFSLWIDINAMKNEYYGITYSSSHPQKDNKSIEKPKEMPAGQPGNKMQGGQDLKFLVENQNLLGATEFYKGKETKVGAGAANIVYENSQLYYIVNFSLKKLSQYDLTGNTICIGLKAENKSFGDGGRPDGGNGGMQGPPSGGGMDNDMGGGMEGGMRHGPPDMQQGDQQQSSSSSPINSWVKINIANQ